MKILKVLWFHIWMEVLYMDSDLGGIAPALEVGLELIESYNFV